MKGVRYCISILFLLAIHCYGVRRTPALSISQSLPYREVAQFLYHYSSGSDIDNYSVEEITQAVQELSKSQNVLKTMDGTTHLLRNTFSKR
jgi:hypothetical protein